MSVRAVDTRGKSTRTSLHVHERVRARTGTHASKCARDTRDGYTRVHVSVQAEKMQVKECARSVSDLAARVELCSPEPSVVGLLGGGLLQLTLKNTLDTLISA